ncbi:MAG: TolC family protein [Flavobacteriales bacterium]
MGDSEDSLWILTDVLKSPPSLPNSIDVRAAVLQDNTSVQNAIISENIAHQGVKQAQAFLYPVVGFNASFSDAVSQGSFGDFSGARSLNTSAFLTLNFNLFNGGATRRAISSAKIQADIAAIDQEQAMNQAGSLSSNAYDKYILGVSVYHLSVQAAQNALTSLEIAETSYKNGVINALDYRTLEIALQRARVNELNALFVWRGAYLEVSRLMGALRAPLLSE